MSLRQVSDDVLQMSVSNTFISSFCQLLLIQYNICGHTSVSHWSLNFDALTVRYGFSSVILVLENRQCESFKVLEFDNLML